MLSKDIGELAQAEFIRAALRRGLKVSEPFGDNTKYDFIIDNGSKLLRIQVKSTATYLEKKDCYQVSTSYGRDRKSLYTHRDIDFFACYLEPLEQWYLIPVYSINTPTIRIFQNSDSSKFTPFKEAWELLCQ